MRMAKMAVKRALPARFGMYCIWPCSRQHVSGVQKSDCMVKLQVRVKSDSETIAMGLRLEESRRGEREEFWLGFLGRCKCYANSEDPRCNGGELKEGYRMWCGGCSGVMGQYCHDGELIQDYIFC